jgi:hypothetical protein
MKENVFLQGAHICLGFQQIVFSMEGILRDEDDPATYSYYYYVIQSARLMIAFLSFCTFILQKYEKTTTDKLNPLSLLWEIG